MSEKSPNLIARWFASSLGRAALSAELKLVSRGIRRFHGDSMLWLSPILPEPGILDRCMVRQKYCGLLSTGVVRSFDKQPASFYAESEFLPIESASLHGIVSHHAIDCTHDPRNAIRELSRVLVPGGHLLLVGFNPLSSWYLRSLYSRIREDAFTDANFVSPYRLLDWLKVLGFEVDDNLNYAMYRPPFEIGSMHAEKWPLLLEYLEKWRPPIGGIYYLLARKASANAALFGPVQSHTGVPGGVMPQSLMIRRPKTNQVCRAPLRELWTERYKNGSTY